MKWIKENKKKILVGIIIVLTVVCIAMIVDINMRFPANIEEVYKEGEIMKVDNLEICGKKAKILEGEELKQYMDDEFSGQGYVVTLSKTKVMRGLIYIMDVKNTGKNEVNLSNYIAGGMAVEAYPTGWANGILFFDPIKPVLQPGEECEFKIMAPIGQGAVKDYEIEEFKNNNSFRLVASIYPVKKMIEFELEE